MSIEYREVNSSNIEAIGRDSYDLYVRFKGSGLYKYKNVPFDITDELMEAVSKGKYLNANIKGKFECEKIGGGMSDETI